MIGLPSRSRTASPTRIDLFMFSNVERPITIQFQPRDNVAIYLAGLLCITGVITARQVAYDANNHGVQLIGKGVTWFAARSSVIDAAGNFDNQTFEQVAKALIAPTGVGVQVIGELDATPFPNLQVEPGEKVWDYLENLARPLGIVMGSDAFGNFLLIGDHVTPVDDTLVEGVNIKSMKFITSIENIYSEHLVGNQSQGTDGHSGAEASQQRASVPGNLGRYSPLLTPAEQPLWDEAAVLKRAKNEAVWHQGDELKAFITVQGWKRASGGLWKAGNSVHVRSPMCPVDGVMSIQNAVFSQDSESGTTTTLECVPPFLLRGKSSAHVGDPNIPQDPTTYANATPAAPATKVPDPYSEVLSA